jgi:hypothetical protein
MGAMILKLMSGEAGDRANTVIGTVLSVAVINMM